jgi:hypothetical protein
VATFLPGRFPEKSVAAEQTELAADLWAALFFKTDNGAGKRVGNRAAFRAVHTVAGTKYE